MRHLAIVFTCLACVFVPVLPGHGQSKMTYTQLAEDIFFSQKDSLVYEGIEFVNDLPERGAEDFISTYIDEGAPETIYGGFLKYLNQRGAKKGKGGRFEPHSQFIHFQHCRFDSDLRFSNVNFKGSVSFEDCDFETPSEDFVGLYGQKFGGAILVDSCSFKEFEVLTRKEIDYRFFLKFNYSSVDDIFFVELQKSTTQIKGSDLTNCKTYIQVHKESNIEFDSSQVGEIYMYLDNIYSTQIQSCHFIDTGNGFLVLSLFSENVNMSNNTFNANTSIQFDKGFLYLDSNIFMKNLAFDYNSLDKTSYLHLESLNHLNFGIAYNGTFYDATTKEQILDEEGYKTYLRVNKSLYDFYKSVGDFESANKVYVKIREIEHRKLYVNYQANPSFKTFFDLNLSRLLKHYTHFGTDPANALVVSFYIVLIFGFIYFFFPSDWDISSKSQLLSHFKDFVSKNEKGYFFPFLKMTLGFLISVANATALSLNAFTTLGFGNIPTKGIARYICILQGFIGWFLLSIFTVALINQAQF
jgi:hypothetical protein